MTDQIAILAEIRPGKRADLERVLAEGPPFDLTKEGFEHHEVFVGDSDVVFVFTGPGAASQVRRMAGTPRALPPGRQDDGPARGAPSPATDLPMEPAWLERQRPRSCPRLSLGVDQP